MRKPIFHHTPHSHIPKNVNELHQAEIQTAGFNQRLAVMITKATGTMMCAYAFALLALLGFPALSSVLTPVVALYVVWFSQTFLQLIFLPILSVGQSVLNRKSELQADEQYHFVSKSYHDIEQIMNHLDQQDQAILEILHRLEERKA